MNDLLFMGFLFSAAAALLYLIYKLSGLDEFLKERAKGINRLKRLMWELQETEKIIGFMYDEGILDKMTTAQREELIKLLAKEYPLWYEVYGKHYNI